MSPRRFLTSCACALAVAASAAPALSQSGLTIQLFQFWPDRLEIATGTRISLTNQDYIEHTVTSGTPERPDGQFRVTLSGKGATRVLTLAKPGVYPYFCERHQSMRGEIRVR